MKHAGGLGARAYRIEDELIWTYKRYGMGIIPWAPIGAGVLSGKYGRDGKFPDGSRSGHSVFGRVAPASQPAR